MANIVVFVEVRAGLATTPSRFAVGEARRVGSDLGATVYAVVAVGPLDEPVMEALAASLGEAGADRILCCADRALAGAPLDVFVGPLLAALAERLCPVLTLFPAGAVGPALGPPLAVRLGGPYHPRAALGIVRRDGEPPRLELRRFRAADSAVRALELGARDRPAVATLVAGPDPGRLGHAAPDVEMVAYAPPVSAGVREVAVEADRPGDEAELASVLLVVDGNVAEQRVAELRAAVAASGGAAVLLPAGAGPGGRAAVAALASPDRLLVMGQGAAAATLARGTLAPSTRVAVVGSKSAEKGLGRIDVVWRAEGDQAVAALVNALAPARRQPGQEAAP